MRISDLVSSPGLVDPVEYFIKHNISWPSNDRIVRAGNKLTIRHMTESFIRLKDLVKIPLGVKLDCQHLNVHIDFDETCKFTSLRGIEKFLVNFNGTLTFGQPISCPVLSILLLPGLKGLAIDATKATRSEQELITNILKKHLGRGHEGLIDAQHELIEAGLEKFAAL